MTLDDRKPTLLRHASYADLFDALKVLGHDLDAFCYYVCAERALEVNSIGMTDAPHWIPCAVFEQLNGVVMGSCKVYTTVEAALADLAAVWSEVLPEPEPVTT